MLLTPENLVGKAVAWDKIGNWQIRLVPKLAAPDCCPEDNFNRLL